VAIFRRVTLVKQDRTTSTLFWNKKRGNRVWRPLRPLERAMRRQLEASNTFTTNLLSRHQKSRGKRREGWLRDGPINVLKASRKALRKL
jgi:hypothetical protein